MLASSTSYATLEPLSKMKYPLNFSIIEEKGTETPDLRPTVQRSRSSQRMILHIATDYRENLVTFLGEIVQAYTRTDEDVKIIFYLRLASPPSTRVQELCFLLEYLLSVNAFCMPSPKPFCCCLRLIRNTTRSDST